jgi:hypothetical protein
MSIVISVILVLLGFIYAKYNYSHDTSRWLRGIKGLLVMFACIILAVGISLGSIFG